VLQLYVTLGSLLLLTRDRVKRRLQHRDDAGLATLEIVIIALGLFVLATALVAAITAAVNSRMHSIH
jgi:hypothetical protein